MNVLEVKGKTVDEAIFTGLAKMGLSIDEVEIDVLQEGGKGFLGMGKTIVRLTKKGKGQKATFNNTVATAVPEPETKKKPAKREKASSKAASAASTGNTADDAVAFLNETFRLMDVPAKAAATEQEEMVSVDISGDSTGILIGRRGETLDALQYLTSLTLNKGKDGYKRVVLDTENYRKKREETLVRLANKIAGKVTKTGRRVVLEPMNPYERRILHSTLQNNTQVESISEGEEPYRRVVIRKKR